MPSFVDDDDDGEPESLHTADPETGYRKGAVSGNKRMTDISGDPDREFAVALSTSCRAFRLDFYSDFWPDETMTRASSRLLLRSIKSKSRSIKRKKREKKKKKKKNVQDVFQM